MVEDRQRDKGFPDPADTNEYSWGESFEGGNDFSDEPDLPEEDSRGRGQDSLASLCAYLNDPKRRWLTYQVPGEV